MKFKVRIELNDTIYTMKVKSFLMIKISFVSFEP